ncbi:hypothetical protein SDC9_88320 [bioreactor metagenome]|uniref:Uncharacterized protein n=1 Tax=bioreactor metagenome TaxID=1076179 RepID=A0A644ZVQ5_9ZZZZ
MRQHDDLFELLVVQRKQLLYFRIGVARFRRHGVVVIKGDISFQIDDFSAFPRTCLGRGASDAVRFPVVFERQIDVTDRLFRCELRLEGVLFPAAAAGDIVKGIGDGIKNCGFAGTGRPANQEQCLVLELREVQYDLFFVGTKGIHL